MDSSKLIQCMTWTTSLQCLDLRSSHNGKIQLESVFYIEQWNDFECYLTVGYSMCVEVVS
jgi:hypothetical protein